jgi:hypothetical protein
VYYVFAAEACIVCLVEELEVVDGLGGYEGAFAEFTGGKGECVV